MRRLTAALHAILVLAACAADDGVLAVDLQTDFVPAHEFDEVIVRLDATGGAPRAAASVRPTDVFSAPRRVADLVELERGEHVVTVELRKASRLVASRSAPVVVSGTTAVLLIITRDCRGRVCPEPGAAGATECVAGRCVAPACAIPGADCAPRNCDVDDQCPVPAPCAEARCVLGVCLAAPGADCPAGTYCDPASGCVPGAPPLDGGVVDAGPQDGGVPADDGAVAPPDVGAALDGGHDVIDGGPDAAPADAPPPDVRLDAAPDVGPFDAGPRDSGPIPDTGVDASFCDAGAGLCCLGQRCADSLGRLGICAPNAFGAAVCCAGCIDAEGVCHPALDLASECDLGGATCPEVPIACTRGEAGVGICYPSRGAFSCCTGCVDNVQGTCRGGTTLRFCGARGAECSACASGQVCAAGMCN